MPDVIKTSSTSIPGVSGSLRRLTVFSFGAYMGYRVFYRWSHIPEAYAAWDTGQLLVKYMELHEDRWPRSWDDLLSVIATESGSRIILRGARAGDTNYAFSLRTKVSVNWKFDTAHPNEGSPVTRLDGTRFPLLWVEPNEMIRAHLKKEADGNHAQQSP